MKDRTQKGRWLCLVLLGWALAASRAAPIVSYFTPASGEVGTQVTVTGAGFAGATQVKFDDVLADFIVTNDAVLVATVPVDAVTGPIRVTHPGGTGSSAAHFQVGPRITGFFPLRAAPGTAVTLDGYNFSGTTNVQFNGSNAAYTVTAPTQIRATVPYGATRGVIQVRTWVSTAVTDRDFLVTGPEPIVDSFSPRFGAPGTEIVLAGANFTEVTAVHFNGIAATFFSAPAFTQIHATVPSAATTGRITVTTAGGSAVSTNDFTVTWVPVITGFQPAIGKAGQTSVTLEGVNFSGVTGVWFNGQPVAAISTPAPNQIRVTVPNGATTGRITVGNTYGYGVSLGDFVVTTAPMVDSFAPPYGPPGTQVHLRGENFVNVSEVRFNGVGASFSPPPASTQFDAWVPASATTGPLFVRNASGSVTTSSNFVVTPSWPFITRFTPEGGPQGTEVSIYGLEFGATPVVRFNGLMDATAYVVGLVGYETKIVATVPAAATTGPITVTSVAGTSTNAARFYLPPRLVAFGPTNGFVGDPVVVTGTNFTGATAVRFHQATASFVVEHPGRIVASVPGEAATGPVTVETPGGVVRSVYDFKVVPRITDVTPGFGPVGTAVTILGSSFHNPSAVSFHTAPADFTRISSSRLETVVPPAGSSGRIRMQTPDGEAVSPADFFVTGSSDLNLDLHASAGLAGPGDPVTYTLIILNHGPWAASGVRLTNVLPAGVAFASVTPSQGACVHRNGMVTCDLGFLVSAASATVAINGQFQVEGTWVNEAAVGAYESDLSPADNAASATTVVTTDEARQLSIQWLGNPPGVAVSWPVSAVPFVLQETAALTAGNSWADVAETPLEINSRRVLIRSVGRGQKFYRLRTPLARD